MLIFRTAFKNLLGAGMRTWLNVVVLSMAFVIIIFYNGMIDGWNQQARTDSIKLAYGGGQLWHASYDPYDPFTLQDAHGKIPGGLDESQLTPILVTQGSIYPQGRMQPVLIKGISPGQKILGLPTEVLQATAENEIPALIGKRMSAAAKLGKGDKALLRWRDKNGTFDAQEIVVVGVFDGNIPNVDNGQIWVSLDKLQALTGLGNEATLLVAAPGFKPADMPGWDFKDLDFLLADLNLVIQSKKAGGSVMYLLLMAIALLAIFDTQVLAIFRRQKEIGTYIALGMTRGQVVRLFTLEGGAISLLATLTGAVYGIPLFIYMAKTGFGMPGYADDTGMAIPPRIFPVYGAGLILGTMALVVISATIVSYLPSRKIAKMNPVEALKGRLQ